jgi:hypothetical protein
VPTAGGFSQESLAANDSPPGESAALSPAQFPGTDPAPDEPEPDLQPEPGDDPIDNWVRDWSYRTPSAYNLVSLQGNSSLAAAMWCTQVAEVREADANFDAMDTSRWGAGQDPQWFSLGSFEGVHAYCVGGVSYTNPDDTRRWAERYKFDFLLDGEESVASLVSDNMLMACNGYRVVIGGKLHVGVNKPGMWPEWHFSGAQVGPAGVELAFIGRGAGTNQVRIQYRDPLQEYQQQFAEANDEWDQGQRGRTQREMIVAEGCARRGTVGRVFERKGANFA